MTLSLVLCSLLSASNPNTFYFGVSNAAFQVEGEPKDSDWRRWTHTQDANGQGHIVDHTNADVATQFWRRYDEDFALAQQAGLNAFRMSIAWERIEPSPGVWDDAALQHYTDMIVAMRKRGLEPFITLQHYVMPTWLADKGGPAWSEYPSHFATFATHVVKALATGPAKVRYFITLNEPNIQVRFGYMEQHRYPPGVDDPSLGLQALAGLAEGHIAVYNAIHALKLPGVQVGYSHCWQITRAEDANNAADVQAASMVNQLFNRAFAEAVTTGKLRFSITGAKSVSRDVPLPLGPTLDFIGVQNYGRDYVTAAKTKQGYAYHYGPGPKNDMGWELVPDALYQAVKEVSVYHVPVIITETGVADANDSMRPQYLRDNFAAMHRALAEGLPLFGYIHWSLTDNFEWAYGNTPKFGLVAMDYKTGARKPRPSLKVYQQLVHDFKKP